MDQDALRPEGRWPQDVDHLLEVVQLPLQVFDVLFEPGALSFGELEAQVEQRRNCLPDGEALATRVGTNALLQAVIEPDSDRVSVRFHSFLHSLSLP
jgi:hypothetical protein